MNICMVLGRCFPPDIRVEKEARSLLSAGHKIFLLSLGKKGMRTVEDINGIKVTRIFPYKSFFDRVWRFIRFELFFEDLLWKRALTDTVKQYKIEVIHVHDLPLVKTATSVGKKSDIPIIADLHENFPEGVRAWRKVRMPWKSKFLNLATPVWRWKRLEKSVLQHGDRIITVVDEAKDHYSNDCRVPPEKI